MLKILKRFNFRSKVVSGVANSSTGDESNGVTTTDQTNKILSDSTESNPVTEIHGTQITQVVAINEPEVSDEAAHLITELQVITEKKKEQDEELARLKMRFNKLEQDGKIESEIFKNANLKHGNELNAIHRSVAELESQNAEAKSSNSKLITELVKLQEENSVLIQVNKKLEFEVSSLSAELKDGAKQKVVVDALRKENIQLLAETQALKQEIESIPNEIQQLEVLFSAEKRKFKDQNGQLKIAHLQLAEL